MEEVEERNKPLSVLQQLLYIINHLVREDEKGEEEEEG